MRRHSNQGGYVPGTAEENAQDRALNRKYDLFIVPFCESIYPFNGLARSKIGDTQTDGFNQDLKMPASAINTATSLFLATHVPQPLFAAIGRRVVRTYMLLLIATGWASSTSATSSSTPKSNPSPSAFSLVSVDWASIPLVFRTCHCSTPSTTSYRHLLRFVCH